MNTVECDSGNFLNNYFQPHIHITVSACVFHIKETGFLERNLQNKIDVLHSFYSEVIQKEPIIMGDDAGGFRAWSLQWFGVARCI